LLLFSSLFWRKKASKAANGQRLKPREEWIEFTSLINIRPAQGNRGLRIEDVALCARIRKIINEKEESLMSYFYPFARRVLNL